MAVRIYRATMAASLAAREVMLVAGLVRERGRATLLVPSFGMRDACRRSLAAGDGAMPVGMAVEVATADSWIAGLWELWGDGRRLVSGLERRLLLARVLDEASRTRDATVATFDAEGSDRGGDAPALQLAQTPGTVDMLAQAARLHLPYLLDRGRSTDADLTAAERRIVSALARYDELLRAAGLIEGSSAARALARDASARASAACRTVVARGLLDLPEYVLELFDAVSATGELCLIVDEEAPEVHAALEERFGCASAPLPAVAPAGSDAAPHAASAPRFAEVAGPSARAAAYVELIAAAAAAVAGQSAVALRAVAHAAPEVAVAAPDALATFRACAPRLAARGIPSQVAAQVNFGDTRAGQAILMLADLLARMDAEEPSAWWPAPEVPDWIRSPFSGLGAGRAAARIARTLDTRLRKTRQLTPEALMKECTSLQSRALARERKLAEEEGRPRRPIVVGAVVEALAAGRYARTVSLMREAAVAASAAAFGWEGAAAQQAELAALDAAAALFETARALGVGERAAFLVLPGLRVRVSCALSPRTGAVQPDAARPAVAPAVCFSTLDELATLPPAARAAVLVLDLNAASYPLARRDTVATLLAAKLGCSGIVAAPAPRQRIAVRRASEATAPGFPPTLARVARDRQGEECFAALAFSELKAAAHPALAPDLAVALPHEGALFANLDIAGGAGARCELVTVAGEHVVDPALNRFLLLPARSVGGQVVPRTLSASQIESYLACPYRWLVSNRATTRRLDVGFGPIEQGNFVHDVMQRFHERLLEAGLMRVTPENLEESLGHMDEAFAEVRADHALGKYTHGRYAHGERPRPIRGALVATDELERNQLDAMLPKLREVVRYECDMLPIYTPARFEYSFDREGVRYAGRPLGGRIDRIDTAPDAGSGERFVVIDYKNRASVTDHACPDPTMMLDENEELDPAWLPGRDADKAPKVQTLIYAAALERLGAGHVQGAIYVGTRGPQVAGAVDDALVSCEPPAFPHDKVSGYPGIKPPRSRTAKRDGSLDFHAMLAQVERAVATELDALEAGAIQPAPAKDSCAYCPLTICDRRR